MRPRSCGAAARPPSSSSSAREPEPRTPWKRWPGIGRLLGAAIGSFVNIFGVELVVVGGGFGAAAADFLFEAALRSAREEALAPGRSVRIVAAELGGKAGLVGAGLVGFEALDGKR